MAESTPKPPRVLLVEDEAPLAKGLADALRFQGYACDVAPDGRQGYDAARKGHYDVMVLDVMLPEVSGFDVMGWTLTTGSSRLEVSLKMILLGLGMGPAIPLFTLAIQSSVPMHQIGVATSTAVFARSVGATIGAAVLSAVLASALASSMAGGHATPPEAWTHAVRVLFQVSAGVAAIALVLTLLLPAVPLHKGAAMPKAAE